MTSLAIYAHIPFCRRICTYCDFYVTTARKFFPEFADAVAGEIQSHALFPNQEVRTLYFGGGTPSFLPVPLLSSLVAAIRSRWNCNNVIECGLEANPNDVTEENARAWRNLGFDRITIGVQSFLDRELKFLTRNHTAEDASRAVQVARRCGFENIGIDLIFGTENQTESQWKHSLHTAISLDVEHVSVYSLTVEDGTHLHKQVEKELVTLPDDENQWRLFMLAKQMLEGAGFEHYEISNYAKPERRAVHNCVYWEDRPYLGLGPSAHSFDGNLRWWNVRSLTEYCTRIQQNQSPVAGKEALTREQRLIETILLGLRQRKGISIEDIEKKFELHFGSHFSLALEKIGNLGYTEDGHFRLTSEGQFLYNAVCRTLTECI